jgi:predicted permease
VTLGRIFLENLLPVMLLAGLGFVLRRRLHIDPRPLSQIVFHAFAPALVFQLLVQNPFSIGDMLRMAAFVIVLLAMLALLAWALARGLRLSRTMASALILCIVFMNAGNLGLPVTQLALGSVALAWASVYFSTTALLSNSAGAWIASVGRASPAEALRGLARVPAVYAIPLALIVHSSGVELPSVIQVPVSLLAAGSVPSMLLLLGMQLSGNGHKSHLGLLAVVAATRLVVSPLVAWAMTSFVRFPPAAVQASILESAMPSAVLNSILATQYDVEPEFVSSAILVTTLISPFTLTPLLQALQSA